MQASLTEFLSSSIRQALLIAHEAKRVCAPNPAVGCVITDSAGKVLGIGRTQKLGDPHAEVMSLRQAVAQGNHVAGATAYVTLEPCSHHGRTPPCCDALIASGIKKVVASIEDPNPLVSGKGFARLRAAGIEVEVGPGAVESRELNLGFFSRMVRETPWVRMKLAASLDGQTALTNGQSQWITGEAARTDGHAWRARSSAVLTGIGTVLADNPRLDVRLVDTSRQPHVVIVDSRLETPLNAHILGAARTRFIYAATRNDIKKAALEALGVTVIHMPGVDPDGQSTGKVDLAAMLRDLAQREVNDLHIEAGHKLNGSFIRAGLVDELLVYLAPKLLGVGQGMASFGPLQSLLDVTPLQFISTQMIGDDLRIQARVAGRDSF